eukprot:CAMPEP_0202729022 /NCGR_PEP_ID=MMETSP1385-20130828/185920_1 /ASSEMBLY_ACC=CAM_ASM_000861 /TAXON_ID=933848 /ORGANISM="Elphidium margaritaceum" /LENGTH=439 /DNA_ID=CAMNT_0049395275 /DNA_START=105 /DNA_END=1427 /DNA_ORIENTATION=+
MLYQKIAYASYIVIQFLATRTTGGTIYVSSSGSSPTCTGTSCTVYCDGSANEINCGSVSTCDVIVTKDGCLEQGTLRAQSNGQILTASCRAKDCFKEGTIYLPPYGSATLDVTSASDGGAYQKTDIFTGDKTTLNLNCNAAGKDECKRTRVYGENARFVKVSVASGAMFEGSKDSEEKRAYIKCPQNSDYSGPYNAPCILDANGGSIDKTTVWASEGTPADFIIEGSVSSDAVDLYCYRSSSWVLVDYNSPGTCYRTRAPTAAPTTTKAPTKQPTKRPTKQPTENPTKQPTKLPTKGPTITPTAKPSAAPTSSPTDRLTETPTQSPSDKPSKAPTTVPTEKPTEDSAEQQVVEEGETSTTGAAFVQNDDPGEDKSTFLNLGFSELELYMVACTLFIIYTCCILGWVILRKMKDYKKKRLPNENDEEEVREDSASRQQFN